MRFTVMCILVAVAALAFWLLTGSGGKLDLALPDDSPRVESVPPAEPVVDAVIKDAVMKAPAAKTEQAERAQNTHGVDTPMITGDMLHAIFEKQACLAGTASAAGPARAVIHRWTDDKGIIHFSDQAPSGAVQEHRQIEVDGLPAIVVHARGYDVNLPDDLVQNAISTAQAIERILRGSLGVDGAPGLVLDIEFIAAADAWQRRAGNPAMANSAGTYVPQSRTIHIRLQDDAQSNLLILRHEITHALIHERIGRLPTAINEGLAGYFEHLTVSGMGAQIRIAESSRSLEVARIEGDGQAELVELFALDGADFYAAGEQQRYRRAYALIAMFMDTDSGRAALAGILAAQRGQPCQPVKAEVILDSLYPGGLPALSRDWEAWLGNPPGSVRSW